MVWRGSETVGVARTLSICRGVTWRLLVCVMLWLGGCRHLVAWPGCCWCGLEAVGMMGHCLEAIDMSWHVSDDVGMT